MTSTRLVCLAVSVFAAAQAGCEPTAPRASGAIERDSSGLRIIEHPRTPTALLTLSGAPVLTIGRSEGSEAYLFDGIVDVLRLPDNRIVIADGGSREIRFFDADGRHLQSVGGSGDGPGEFQQLGALVLLSEDTIAVWDPGAVRLSLLASDGHLIHDLRVMDVAGSRRPELLGFFDDRSFVISADAQSINELFASVGVRRPPVAYLRFDLDGRLVDTLVTAPGREVTVSGSADGGQLVRRMFGRQTFADVIGYTIYVANNDRYEIRAHGLDSSPVLSIRKASMETAVTEEHLWAMWQDQLRGYPSGLREQVEADLRTRGVADTPHNETLPAFLGIHAIDDERLWVLESVVPGEPERWARLGPGATHDIVEMPPGFRALRFESSYVLGVGRDELEVERLEIFALKRSR